MPAFRTSGLRSSGAVWWLGLGATVVAAAVLAAAVDAAVLADAWASLRRAPLPLAVVLLAYAAAFALRALAWRRTLPSLPFGHALAALHVSTGANHVLPLRLGEVLRVTSVVRRTGVGLGAATASTVSLRAADLLALGSLAAVLGPGLALDVVGPWGPVLLGVAALATVLGGAWLSRLRRLGHRVRVPGPLTLAAVALSWMLEAAVVHQAAAWAGLPLDLHAAVLVTAVTIAAQTAAIAPGGFGTYEAAATAVLVALGADAGTALAVALTAHAVKTAYALVTGAVAVLVPAPTLLGRLRLPRPAAAAAPARAAWPQPPADPARPVVLFLPAHDEEEAVAGVVARVPDTVAGHPVRCLVIDDGSRDRTAERAALAGAEVVSLGRNTGLGAAVRRGLAEAVARDAVAVAFCDADGEYAPEELTALVRPLLAGDADYVVGSRFAGDIQRMLPHRRLGNHVLTLLLRFVTRRADISDGQSGYRALSAAAARRARVAHDFNYAQVLTIDLLAQGARYVEVPISYRFRETGRSFVRLGRYLTAVLPTIHRELNRDVVAPARSEA